MKLRIGTLNCQNNEENRDMRNDNAETLANHIIENKYDILGTQELTINFTDKLSKFLNNHFIYGKFQYGRGIFGTKIPILKNYNQGNQVITHLESNKINTYTLPWIPKKFCELKKAIKKGSMTKRILTVVETNINNNKVYVLNTHLDYYISSVQFRQLNYLYNKITNYIKKGYVILMGDFNLDLDNEMFKIFIKKLTNIGVIRVPMNEKTNDKKYRQKTAIDHIFISKEFKLLEYGSIEDLDEITDHKIVYADIFIND